MKYYSAILLLLCTFFVAAQEIQVTVNTQNCEEGATLSLMEFDGFNFTAIDGAPVQEGKTVFTLPETMPRVYYIGTNSGNMLPIILGSEKEVSLTAQCTGFRSAKVNNSALNAGYL